jgi:hypothetical protein
VSHAMTRFQQLFSQQLTRRWLQSLHPLYSRQQQQQPKYISWFHHNKFAAEEKRFSAADKTQQNKNVFFQRESLGDVNHTRKKTFLTWKDDHILSTFSSPHNLIF